MWDLPPLPFFYQRDVVGRAATLVHESRHFGGKSHDANFRSWSAFPVGKSGADSSWDYQGAWMFDVLYLLVLCSRCAHHDCVTAIGQTARQFSARQRVRQSSRLHDNVNHCAALIIGGPQPLGDSGGLYW